jgi:hypothetical protein
MTFAQAARQMGMGKGAVRRTGLDQGGPIAPEVVIRYSAGLLDPDPPS